MAQPDVKIKLTADDKTKAAFASANANLQKLQSGAARLTSTFGALGVAVSVGGIATFAKSTIDAADGLQDMSDRLGVSVKDLASFKLAAQLADTSLEGVGKGIQKLTLSIGQAEQGLSTQAKALQTLGITARDPKEAFFQLADAVASSNDPIKTNAALNDVLGRSYTDLLPLLQQGGEGLRKSARESESFAEAMERLAPNAGKLNDQLDTLKNNAAGFAAVLLSDAVPAVNEFFKRVGLVKDLLASGGVFNTMAITAGTDDLNEVMRRLQENIKATQAAFDGETAKGKDASGFAEKLRGLKAQRDLLIQIRTAEAQKPPETETMRLIKADRARVAGRGIDLSAAAKGKTIDKADLYADTVAAGWKSAGEELNRYAETRDFVLQGDLERDNAVNDIAQGWVEAGRALKDEMMTPLEKFNVEMGRLDVLLEKGAIDFETYSRAVFEGFERNETKIVKVKTLAEDLGDAFKDTFDGAGTQIRNLGDLFDTLKQKVASVFANRAGDYAANAITDFFFKPSANGNVFNSPALSAYSGSVVSSPTVFPFANGIGLMGEAGAEAILPLKRGRDGKLGVSMDGGGGVVVQNYYTIDARGAESGVEQRIRRAIADSEDRAVSRSVTQVQSMNQRGQLRLT